MSENRSLRYDQFLLLFNPPTIESRNSRIQKCKATDRQYSEEQVVFQYDISVSTQKHEAIHQEMKKWETLSYDKCPTVCEVERIYIKSEINESSDLAIRSYFFLTPHRDFKSLQDFKQDLGSATLPILKIKEWFVDLVYTLEHIHGKGLIHRNLNNTSVLIDSEDSLRLTQPGFGFREIVDFLDDIDLYTDPEVFDNYEFTPRSDIFSLGTFFHTVLCDFDEEGEIVEEYEQEEENKGFIELIRKCAEEDPNDRPESMKSVLEEVSKMFPEILEIVKEKKKFERILKRETTQKRKPKPKKKKKKKKKRVFEKKKEVEDEESETASDDEVPAPPPPPPPAMMKKRGKKKMDYGQPPPARKMKKKKKKKKKKMKKKGRLSVREEKMLFGDVLAPPKELIQDDYPPMKSLPKIMQKSSIGYGMSDDDDDESSGYSAEEMKEEMSMSMSGSEEEEEIVVEEKKKKKKKKRKFSPPRKKMKRKKKKKKSEWMYDMKKADVLDETVDRLGVSRERSRDDIGAGVPHPRGRVHPDPEHWDEERGVPISPVEGAVGTEMDEMAAMYTKSQVSGLQRLFVCCFGIICLPCLLPCCFFRYLEESQHLAEEWGLSERTEKERELENKQVEEALESSSSESEGEESSALQPPAEPIPIKLDLEQDGLNRKKLYQVKKVIGQGGQSSVYLVEKDGKTSTMKRYKSGTMDEFQAEVVALKQLAEQDCKHVVKFIEDFGYRDEYGEECRFIIMEYCQQGDLQKVLRKKTRKQKRNAKRLEEKLIYTLIRDLSVGILEVHASNFCHHDLKSPNIFVTESGEVRIGDFGFAIKEGEEPRGVSGGTLKYMSPEARKGEIGKKYLDIWSMGTLFAELIYCKVVDFKTKTEQERSVFIQGLWIENSKLKELIIRCFFDDSSKRIKAEELAEEVKAICEMQKKEEVEGEEDEEEGEKVEENVVEAVEENKEVKKEEEVNEVTEENGEIV